MVLTRTSSKSWSAIIALMAIIITMLVVVSPRAKAATTSKVIVSLTWDDGRANQASSVAIQNAHGMKATYYINSGDIGTSDYYLTKSGLDAIAADGNEIGGHTVNHERLTAIPLDAATAAVCNDRQTLIGWYGPAAGRSFAYPFGAYNADVAKIPQSCGYTSARTVTGIRMQNSCFGCPTAESLPPRNPWTLAVPTSVTTSTTLDALKFQIDQAATNGGGWVIYTMHSLGEPGDTYNIDPVMYDAFLTWLAARSDVEVRTVGDVMSTAWPSPTTTSTAPTTTVPPAPPVPVAMVNADLEIDANANGVSDCWLRGQAGTNSATWKRTTDAHSGTAAEEVTISAFTSGDRKIVPMLDNGTANGGCAPSVRDSITYSMSVWYRSTGASNIVVFTRDSAGAWKYWRTGPQVAPSGTWARTNFSPGALPAGTTAISFGLALKQAGTLATDDYSMTQDPIVTPPATDPAVKNSSFETDSNNDGMADCWLRGGYGSSTVTFQRTSDAHSGAWGQKLTVSGYSTGDRKIVQPLDAGQSGGGCAPTVTAGSAYRLSTWYRSDAQPVMFVYLRDSSGIWRWWISTFQYPTAAGWTQVTYTTPPIPAGSTAISFGLGLISNGSLVVDDASMTLN